MDLPLEEDKVLSQQETLLIINFIGYKLSEKIDLSEKAARGLIKLSIIDEFDPFKPLSELKLINLKMVIKNSLKKRLLKLETIEIDSIITFLLDELISNQSIIVKSIL